MFGHEFFICGQELINQTWANLATGHPRPRMLSDQISSCCLPNIKGLKWSICSIYSYNSLQLCYDCSIFNRHKIVFCINKVIIKALLAGKLGISSHDALSLKTLQKLYKYKRRCGRLKSYLQEMSFMSLRNRGERKAKTWHKTWEMTCFSSADLSAVH